MSVLKFVFIFLLTVAGCSTGSQSSVASATHQPDPTLRAVMTQAPTLIELKYDMVDHYQDMELRWLDLQDSRCPIGVKCVWAGQMLATVEITKSDEPPIQVKLLRRAGREPQVSRAFGHELRLQIVEPHPKNGVTFARSDFRMQLEFTAR